jgi:hypothetical protein
VLRKYRELFIFIVYFNMLHGFVWYKQGRFVPAVTIDEEIITAAGVEVGSTPTEPSGKELDFVHKGALADRYVDCIALKH